MKITPDEKEQTPYYFEELFCGPHPLNLIGYTPNKGAMADSIYDDWISIAVGDLIIVMQGMSLIFGVVEIRSESMTSTHDYDRIDWFQYRRKAGLIKKFNPALESPETAARKSIIKGNAPNAQKISEYIWDLISEDYQKIKWNTLMENAKLTFEKKSKLINLWKKYRSVNASKYQENEYKRLVDEWHIYKRKLQEDEFRLEDYANRLSNNSGLPGGYLCNFLERTTKKAFGSSKPGNAFRYGLKKNNDESTYAYQEKEEKVRTIDQKAATEIFDAQFMPFLKELVSDKSIEEKISLIEERNDVIASRQLLRKLLAIDIQGEFLYIYAEDVIDQLFEEFVGEGSDSVLSKNRLIYAIIKEIFGVGSDAENQYLISLFLWQYATARAVADGNDPNVILYGPPGTGKTYAVLKSLELMTLGDDHRVGHLQFHPSFAYEDFIEGIKPKGVTPDGNIRFEMVNGVFKVFCIKAKNDPQHDYYFVVDEINRANLSTVFGEVLFCLEKDYRRKVRFGSGPEQEKNRRSTENLVKTQYSSFIEQLDPQKRKALAFEEIGGEVYFGVPENVYFIGMMNDVDENIDTFDLALRRRFKWIRKDCDYEALEEYLMDDRFQYENIEDYVIACKQLNRHISHTLDLGSSYEFGHAFFMKITDIAGRKKITKKNMEQLFHLHMRPTLKEYLRAFVVENELDPRLKSALDIFQKPISQ